MTYACLGDSITSDQVTGIGTVVAEKLGAQMLGNFACGYATCSDWHDGPKNITTVTLAVPPNTNTDDNVLSNQVRRLLQAVTPKGQPISWTHRDGEFALDESVGVGLGCAAPDVIYIAISTNDGNQPYNAVTDDRSTVLTSSYRSLTRSSLASALRWAIETLHCACPTARIFVATPLQAYSDQPWMSLEQTRLKRDIIISVCQTLDVDIIDSFTESGFTQEVARAHGEVHPDEEWKERIASFVAKKIRSAL